jgi:hypothetical protein
LWKDNKRKASRNKTGVSRATPVGLWLQEVMLVEELHVDSLVDSDGKLLDLLLNFGCSLLVLVVYFVQLEETYRVHHCDSRREAVIAPPSPVSNSYQESGFFDHGTYVVAFTVSPG